MVRAVLDHEVTKAQLLASRVHTSIGRGVPQGPCANCFRHKSMGDTRLHRRLRLRGVRDRPLARSRVFVEFVETDDEV